MHSMQECKIISDNQWLCKNAIPLTLNDPNCELEVITHVSTKKCKPIQIGFSDYNVIRLKKNRYILIISQAIPVVTNCQGEDSKTQLITSNSLLYLYPRCSAFIGSTQLYAYDTKSSNSTKDDIIPMIPFDCCEEDDQQSEKHLNLDPIHINKLSMDDLNIAEEQLKNQEKVLNSMKKQTFAQRHLSVFTIMTLSFMFIILFYCCCKRNLRKCIEYKDSKDKSLCVNIFNNCRTNRTTTRQESIHSHELQELTINPEVTPRRSQRLQKL